ncbi:ATP-binding protein [Phytoactinopolyspora limicola]|uniref:ATP-binding protein n=1 Tax=Phytoactinopolyspora limicola TaxID=2715536 RepID=UPI001A9C3299|nr:ATP-binding protein [Phytoactinopolyspora limicola]
MAMTLAGTVERRLERVLRERMRDAPVVLVNGPRTVGKSTMLAALAGSMGATVIDLDDVATWEAVQADPALFASAPSPVLIDEYQHVPELLSAIKAELNRDLRPGRYVLTGSTRYGSLPQVARVLTGRVHVLDLLPLSQGEIGGTAEVFVDQLLEHPAGLVTAVPSATGRDEYVQRVVWGGFPLALRSFSDDARARWLRDYVDLVISKDVVELSRVRKRAQLPQLLRRLASQTGQAMNLAEAARAAELDRSTTERYAALLEAVFLIRRLPAWGTTLAARVGNNPKLHIVDSGLAAWLLGLTERKLAGREPAVLTEFGHLLETFVVGEVIKQTGWSQRLIEVGHFRTRDGIEVDLVLEADDGSVAAVEVKASSRVTGRDLAPLRLLRDKLGQRFVGGVALYLGARSYTYDDRLHVAPVDTLWRHETLVSQHTPD